MKRLNLDQLLANGVTLANNAQAIQGGKLELCHNGMGKPKSPPRDGVIVVIHY